jgi:cellulose synthase/poly-beta-1,6-N-acetylglucosamine synthase-like glycosyltransferase
MIHVSDSELRKVRRGTSRRRSGGAAGLCAVVRELCIPAAAPLLLRERARAVETFPIYLFIFIVFFNRYIFGLYLTLLRRGKLDETITGYEPTVTVVVPLFNEGRSIYDTIQSLVRLEYPREKLSVTVVDDCSTDDSYEWACRAAAEHRNVRVLRNPYNMGKRKGINHAVREATAEIIVSVDSDVIIYPTALRELIARFTSPEIAAVGGRVHVSNPNENWLTRLQTIKYYFGQEHLKNLERALRSVLCLSGCLTAYRRSVLMQLEPILEQRNLLGVPIKYGEDRFLTHQIVRHGYRTVMTMAAMCFTKAPTTLRGYFNQQLRWKRSNIVDFIVGLGDAWRLHPLVCLQYLSMLLLLIVYPLVIITHVHRGDFWYLATAHVVVVGGLSLVYYFAPSVRALPPWLRVHPIAFLPMAVLMPVAYLLLTPLGLFTLDSSSWETRGHGGAPTPAPAPPAIAGGGPS